MKGNGAQECQPIMVGDLKEKCISYMSKHVRFIFKISHKLDAIYGINQKDENHILDILRLGKGQYRSNLLFALY